MTRTLQTIIGMLIAIIIADICWLSYNNAYHLKFFESVQKTPLQIRLIPAVLVYILILASVYYFAVHDSNSIWQAATRGAGIGFSMYGLYDLTNYATLQNYTVYMTVTDTVWGTILCGFVAAVGAFIRLRG